MVTSWKCAAIDHGVTVFPNGKIGPCCRIQSDYLKPISELSNRDRFADLKTEFAPSACQTCIAHEDQGITSYRQHFNSLDNTASGLQFVDIRNTNFCNLKCRYCGPHFSNQWAVELGYSDTLQHQSVANYQDILFTDSLHWMYFTGGEPLINGEHWDMLEQLISKGLSKNISLMYNTNLTTIHYKQKNVIDIWQQFKSVNINCSIDAIGSPLEYIRSGTDWQRVSTNLEQLLEMPFSLTLTPVISILNVWFLPELLKFAQDKNIPVEPEILTGPDYLALDVCPDQLQTQATEIITSLVGLGISKPKLDHMQRLVNNNINQCLFSHTLNHVLLLDKLRNEKLFDLLPFKNISIDQILKNNEYL